MSFICFILDATIKANGYRSKNTSDYHCAGGSSGGLIRLQAYKVKQYSRTGGKNGGQKPDPSSSTLLGDMLSFILKACIATKHLLSKVLGRGRTVPLR